jgi:hypothetical protein
LCPWPWCQLKKKKKLGKVNCTWLLSQYYFVGRCSLIARVCCECRKSTTKLKVVVRVRDFFSMPDGLPNQYCRRERLQPWFVDKDNYNLLQLVNDIAQHCLWGSKQYIILWRDLDDVSVEIKTDENSLD